MGVECGGGLLSRISFYGMENPIIRPSMMVAHIFFLVETLNLWKCRYS